MNWLNVFTANTANYANGTNHFPGTLRDMRAPGFGFDGAGAPDPPIQ